MPKVDWNTGAYKWTNLQTGMVYVGGAYKSFEGRRLDHLQSLRRGTHQNKHFQASWNKWGEESFEFSRIECCHPNKVKAAEQRWLDHYEAGNHKLSYNNSPTAGSNLGCKMPEEGKAKLRKTSKAMWEDPEIRGRIVAKLNTPEALEKNSKHQKEVWSDPEFKAKMKAMHVERCKDPAVRQKMSEDIAAAWDEEKKAAKSEFMVDKWQDPTYCELMEEAHKRRMENPAERARVLANSKKGADVTRGKPLSEEHRKAIADAHIGMSPSEETRRKIALTLTGRKQSPELVEKRMSAIRGKKRTPEQKANILRGQAIGKLRRLLGSGVQPVEAFHACHGMLHKAHVAVAGAVK